MKHFANENNIQIFEAVERFYQENFGYQYGCEIDMIQCFCYLKLEQVKLNLNGLGIEEVMKRISSEQNEACLPVIEVCLKTSYRRFIFLTESNKFFLDNGVYLGNNYQNIINKIFNNEITVEPILCYKIFDTLARHGWSKNKNQNISDIVEEYHELGIELFPTTKSFFEIVPQGEYIDWFYTHGNSHQRVIVGKPKSRLCYLKNYLKDSEKYFNVVREKLVEICQLIGFASYHVYFSESGKFYVDFNSSEIHYITDDVYLFV